MIAVQAATKPDGEVVPPSVAANRVVGILGQTRTVIARTGSQGETKKEPLGELVSVNIELQGLRGQFVFLSWSIFQKGSHNNLFGRWLSDFVAFRLQATTDDDSGSLKIWIPVPKTPGPYFIQLSLTTDGANLASMTSDPFD
jgi:hypothetical protein